MCIQNNDFYLYFSESIKIKEKSIVLITAEEEYAKCPEISKQTIEDIRQWMTTQPHLPQNVPGKFTKLFILIKI